MLVVVVYESDGTAAKERASECEVAKPDRAIAIQADVWDGKHPSADEVIFMDEVPAWKRERIEVARGNEPAVLAENESGQAEPLKRGRGRPPKVREA